MRLPSLRIMLLITYLTTSGVATISQAHRYSLNHAILAHLPEEFSSFLRGLTLGRENPASTASATVAPTLAPVFKRDPKKSESSSADSTTSEDASQPTSGTSEHATTEAVSTIIVSPTPRSSPSTSSTSSATSSSISSLSTSSTSLITTTSSTFPSSTTTTLAASATPIATSTPSKSNVSTGLIAGVVIAILFVLASLTWVISMRRHLQQREWQFKYHERIFDGPEGLLGKKQQAQQRQEEEVHEMVYPTSTGRKGTVAVATEKELPAHPGAYIQKPQRVFYGKEVKRKPVGGGKHGFERL